MDLIDREHLMNYIRSRKINIGKLAHDIIMKQPSICDDAVSRQAVKDWFCTNYCSEHNKCEHFEQGDCNAMIELFAIPPVNPQEPKTGHWIEENINEGGRKVFCSECGCPPPFEHINTGDVYSASGYGVINKTKFCPSCGVRMESEDKE